MAGLCILSWNLVGLRHLNRSSLCGPGTWPKASQSGLFPGISLVAGRLDPGATVLASKDSLPERITLAHQEKERQ